MDTRSRILISIDQFFKPCLLPKNYLPSISDIIQLYLLKKKEFKNGLISNLELYKILADEVMAVWNILNIEILTKRRITAKIEFCIKNFLNLKKFSNKRKKSKSLKTKFEKFVKSSKNLFDISICKCTRTKLCKGDCETSDIIKLFLEDQRSLRQQNIEFVKKRLYNLVSAKNAESPQIEIPKLSQESLKSIPVASNEDNSQVIFYLQDKLEKHLHLM